MDVTCPWQTVDGAYHFWVREGCGLYSLHLGASVAVQGGSWVGEGGATFIFVCAWQRLEILQEELVYPLQLKSERSAIE